MHCRPTRFLLALGLSIPLAAPAAERIGYLTLGPMVHFNFSQDSFRYTGFGLEGAYWIFTQDYEDEEYKNRPKIQEGGIGMDVGFEIGGGGYRLYAEPQVGWVFAGLSAGPVLEFAPGKPPALGVQASGWVNMVGGFDFRYRRLNGANFQAVGLYAKLGRPVHGVD